MKPGEFFRNEDHFQKWAVEKLRQCNCHVQVIAGDGCYPGIPDLSIGMPNLEVWAEVKLWRGEHSVHDTLAEAMARERPLTAQQLHWLCERERKGGALCGVLIGWRTKYSCHYVSFIPANEWETRCHQPLMVLALAKCTDTLDRLINGSGALTGPIKAASMGFGTTIAQQEDWRADHGIVLENPQGVQILEGVRFFGHYGAVNAQCECGEELIVAPRIFKADHKKGDPVMVCGDHGVHAYRFSTLVIGRQPKGSAWQWYE